MQTDPMEEWRRLTALYSEMSDVEIRELADQMDGLTETAQQILRDEMKKRGMGTILSSRLATAANDAANVQSESAEDSAEESQDEDSEEAGPDYSWKVPLCRCESLDEAAARCEMLRRAKLDRWLQRSGSFDVTAWDGALGAGDFQINVAADQLDEARAIISQPIPQDILDQVKEEKAVPEYQAPVCPKCRTADPTLESVEPSNNWLCESCGCTWSDPVDDVQDAKTSA